ncbi:MAG TPA: SRPBCC family protein [Candidatus Dormibacteraeota bacterium]
MTRIREEVSIEAPAERVWAVVHEDLKNAPKWSGYLSRATRKGSTITYQVRLPAWKGTIEVEEETKTPYRKCAGVFTDGPLEGEWSYSYSQRGARTKLVYEMDYRLKGVLRFLGGALAGQYAAGIRDQMQSLKAYIESGKGPKK